MIIIDTGTSNAFSIQRALSYLGYKLETVDDPGRLESARGIILPGVGNFDAAISTLSGKDLIPLLRQKVIKNKTPILGICVGMQMLFEGSDEGKCDGLGFLPGKLTKLQYQPDSRNKVPNTGFRNVELDPNNALNKGLPGESYFYFNHSYALASSSTFNAIDISSHEFNFVASFQHENMFGVQYHPEKSQLAGLKILKNFIEVCEQR